MIYKPVGHNLWMTAAMHCIENAQYINQILQQQPTTIRVMDEDLVRKAIEETADKLSFTRVKVNVSTQNRLKAHIYRLERDLAQTRTQNLALRETNIILQSTLEANEEKYNKLLTEQLSAAELRAELEKIESFEMDVNNRTIFATPKKGVPMPTDDTVVGDGEFRY